MSTKNRYIDKGNTPSIPYTGQYFDATTGALLGSHSGTAVPINIGYEDSVITTSSSPKMVVKTCEHSTVEKTVRVVPESFAVPAGTGVRYTYTPGIPFWHIYPGLTVPTVEQMRPGITYPKTKAQVLEEARSAFFSVNETDNLLNILEADQTISSLNAIGSFIRDVYSGSNTVLGRRRLYDKYFRLSTVSNSHLAWSFGFAPLISDLKKLSRALPLMRKRLRQLAVNASKPRSVVRHVIGSYSNTDLSGISGYWPVNTPQTLYTWWREQVIPVTAPIYVAGVHGKRAVKYNSSLLSEVDYVLSHFIATGPVSLAWEKVKFSFVVDWFLNLTPVIDQLDNALTGFNKQIDYAWTSEKYDLQVAVVKQQRTDEVMANSVGRQVLVYRYRYYRREPASLDFSIKASGRFGKKQEALSLSLLHQKVANLVRKR